MTVRRRNGAGAPLGSHQVRNLRQFVGIWRSSGDRRIVTPSRAVRPSVSTQFTPSTTLRERWMRLRHFQRQDFCAMVFARPLTTLAVSSVIAALTAAP
jgi:hypothetical protein